MTWAQRIFGGTSKAAKRALLPQRRAPQPSSPLAPLVGVARQSDVASRSQLAQQLSDFCLATGRDLSNSEQKIFFDILRHLIHRIEIQVRKSVAEKLSVRPDAPHDIVFQLASDVIEVAYPILVRSDVLEDADLIDLILYRAQDHQRAISQRAAVSVSVTETLVGTGDHEVIQSLLQNNRAEIMPETMARLVDQSLEVEGYQEPLLRRNDLDSALARRMYTWVGEALREYINDTYDLPQDDVNDAISVAIADAANTDFAEAYDDTNVINFQDFASTPQYDSSSAMLILALEDGDIYRFEEMFSQQSRLSAGAITRLLYDSGSEALAIAFKAVGTDRQAFSEIFCYLRGSRPYEAFVQSPQHAKAMEHFDQMDMASADRILETWRITPADDFAARNTA